MTWFESEQLIAPHHQKVVREERRSAWHRAHRAVGRERVSARATRSAR